ncbi:MAG: hypothetical protein P4L49_13270 [Desulfosporosinus sp.]|nr:hypothetical protein [Desulfosporosinus sp.]
MQNVIKLKISDGDKIIFENQFLINDVMITINDDFVLNILKPFNIYKDSIKHCYFTFGLTNVFVDIKDYSLTNQIYIEGFYNQPSYIAFLRCTDTRLHIVNQNIQKMQIDGYSLLVAECKIEKIEIGLNKQAEILRNKQNINEADIHIDSIDIRYSVIDEIKLLASCDNLNIQESEVKILRLGNMFGTSRNIGHINIWRNCMINTIELACPINEMKMSESTISYILSKAKCKINSLEIKQVVLNNAYDFDLNSFNELNVHSWLLISKSAASSKDMELVAQANYNISDLYMKEKPWKIKIPMLFFKATTGYGYKPFRIIWFSLIVLLIFCGIFSLIDTITLLHNSCQLRADILLNIFQERIIYSFSSFAGTGGNQNFKVEFVFTLLENILGIVAFAMFVNALYVKYKGP